MRSCLLRRLAQRSLCVHCLGVKSSLHGNSDNRSETDEASDKGNLIAECRRRIGYNANMNIRQSSATMTGVFRLLQHRVVESIKILPTPAGWAFVAMTGLASAVPIIPSALWAKAFSLPHANFSPLILLKAMLVPCLAEELLWRVLMNPSPGENRAPVEVIFWGVFSTLAFVVAHPVNACLFRPVAKPVFCHPGFLLACAALGGACAVAYNHTGSVWAPVSLHWAAVALWLSLGGRHQAPFF